MSDPEMKGFLAAFRTNFFTRLEQKTGWGKEEVKQQFIEAALDASFDTWEENHHE